MTIESHTYTVPEISCDHCKQSIESKVSPVAGVQSIDVDVTAKVVTVVGGDSHAIETAIAAAGYAIA